MEDMKNWIYIALITLFASGIVACSEDDVTLDPELSALPYDLPRGEEGALEELIYTFHERYGSYVIYDVTEVELNSTWENRLYNEIVPVDADTYRDCMGELVAFMMDSVFASYPDEFIGELLPRRIYLVDTLKQNNNMLNMTTLENHSLVISRVGEEMAAFTESDWEDLNMELTGAVLGNLTVPQEFYDLIVYDNLSLGILGFYMTDPEGEFDDYHYGIYSCGLLTSGMRDDAYGMFYVPEQVDDLASYLIFFMSTPATEIEHVCGRFEVIKDRARVMVRSLLEEQELDLVAIQNANCPDDPLVADFFNE